MDPRKLLRTVLIIVIAGAAIGGIVDDASEQYAQQSLNRALVTFTAARALNGVISVAQGTEVAVEPGGVGVILTPGQVLDPLNDLVERFSSVMLVAASSLGLQLVLLKITSSWGVNALLVFVLAAWLASVWLPVLKDSKYIALTLNVTLILIFVRFAVPVVIICTNFMFSTFLLTEHDSATAALEGTSAKIEEVNVEIEDAAKPNDLSSQSDGQASSQATDESLMDRLPSLSEIGDIPSQIKSSTQEWYSNFADWLGSVSVSARLEQLEASAAEAASHIVNLIVIFVLQTIIFPLGFLWMFVEVLKAAGTRSIGALGLGNS
ncbi:MAG: hypothetical protein OEU36_25470 [Gammaproteobacteria bacterium]|nr:hypothetical protein [Gammaproteobacteria bacterium]